MVSKLSDGELTDAAKSWLGDGGNKSVSAAQITESLGADKVSSFASRLGLSQDDAAEGLAGMIPDLVNQSSKGGSLLEAAGGLASKLFKWPCAGGGQRVPVQPLVAENVRCC